jgi:hypothetical protein
METVGVVPDLVEDPQLKLGKSSLRMFGSEPKTGTAMKVMMAMMTSGMGLLKLVRAEIIADLNNDMRLGRREDDEERCYVHAGQCKEHAKYEGADGQSIVDIAMNGVVGSGRACTFPCTSNDDASPDSKDYRSNLE